MCVYNTKCVRKPFWDEVICIIFSMANHHTYTYHILEGCFVPCLHHKVMASSLRNTHRLNSAINAVDPFLCSLLLRN